VTIEAELKQRFPRIAWTKPLPVASPKGEGLACRFCIARYGLSAREIPLLPKTEKEFLIHLKEFHNE
jgi:hypothetical protein